MSESPFRDPTTVDWDFQAEGCGWGENTWERTELIEEFKLEFIDSKLVDERFPQKSYNLVILDD